MAEPPSVINVDGFDLIVGEAFVQLAGAPTLLPPTGGMGCWPLVLVVQGWISGSVGCLAAFGPGLA